MEGRGRRNNMRFEEENQMLKKRADNYSKKPDAQATESEICRGGGGLGALAKDVNTSTLQGGLRRASTRLERQLASLPLLAPAGTASVARALLSGV